MSASLSSLRPAVVSDAETLSRVGREAFIESFGFLYTPQNLEAFLAAKYNPITQLAEITRKDGGVWVAEVEGKIAGYIVIGPCGLPHDEVSEGDGEIYRLYLLNEFQGYRLGRGLMQAALKDFQRRGVKHVWLGVWSENFRAQKFYQSFGFREVGNYWFVVGDQKDFEFIYRAEL